MTEIKNPIIFSCHRRQLLAGLLLFIVIFIIVGLSFRSIGAWVATGAAEPVPADVIVVLGGDDGHRVRKAAEVFHAGYSNTIVLTGIEGAPERERVYYLNWRAKVLADAGVEFNRIVFESAASNSLQEAHSVLALLQGRGWGTAIVISDPPHMRRLNWVWGRVFSGTGKSYRLVASNPTWWDAERWWISERSGQFVLTELIKIAYYIVKY